MIYCFDLDNTLCNTVDKDYDNSTPIQDMIDRVNYLHDNGHEILIFTARGMGKFKGDINTVYNTYYDKTESQLKKWGIKYNKLILGKPSFDFFIDDKNQKIDDFKLNVNPKIGFIAGSFDVIHPGYIHMFNDIKEYCDYLIVGLHDDPSSERPNKIKPILSVQERKDILSSLRFINEIIVYSSEKELLQILLNNKIDIRFLGEDYKDSNYTGIDLPIKVHFIERNHGWSTTKFKKLISESII
jgi:glycerol-3-phosphate cytidylyltransferase